MNRFWKAIILTTLVAGTLDIIAAHVHGTIKTGVFPSKMFYYIAGGALGVKTSFSWGVGAILLGVFIHYFISFSFTLFFYLVYPVFSKISSNKYVNGVIYAGFTWLVMNFLVLPITRLPRGPFVFDLDKAIGLVVLMVVFGLPISVMTDKYYRRNNMNKEQAGVPQGQYV